MASKKDRAGERDRSDASPAAQRVPVPAPAPKQADKPASSSRSGRAKSMPAIDAASGILQGRLDVGKDFPILQIAPGDALPLADIVKDKGGTLTLVLELGSSARSGVSPEDLLLDQLKAFLGQYAKLGIYGSITTGRPPSPKPPPGPAAPPPSPGPSPAPAPKNMPGGGGKRTQRKG